MKRSVLTTQTWVLLVTAVLLVVAGALNFSERLRRAQPPTDGVEWVQVGEKVVARAVTPGLVGNRAQLLPEDRLIAVSFDDVRYEQIVSAADLQIYLEQAGVGGTLHYWIERPSFPEETRFYKADIYGLDTVPTWTERDLYINFIGIIYLLIGLFVLFKQGGRAPFVPHFATLCLTAFVFHFYKPVGSYEDLDLAIAFLDDAALITFAPLFVHFCLIYPVRRRLSERRPWLAGIIYVPAVVLLICTAVVYFLPPSLSNLPSDFINQLFQAGFAQFLLALVIGASILVHRFVSNKTTIVRQQLKWVVWGLALAATPFALLYATSYLFGFNAATGTIDPLTERWLTTIAIVPLVLIPLSFGNSVVRYRLMDVDVVVRRAAVYALTTLAIAVMLGAVVYTAGLYALGGEEMASGGFATLRVSVGVIGMALVVMSAAPLKNYLQQRTDRLFYGERYDLRNGLLDFGRTLSATTVLDPLLDALINWLRQVLDVERVAIFIEEAEAASGYRVARTAGLSNDLVVPPDFRDMIRVRSAATGIVRADDLDLASETSGFVRRALHYYVPCVVRGRMVAVIGLGRSANGALLSSEDLRILHTVSGYVAVAIENSLLYQEQRERAAELELLKEFNESIVESINVGLLAVDTRGRVTRCNSALEEMLGLNRDQALDCLVEELFADDFAETLKQVLGSTEWRLPELRNIYKLHTATRAGRSLVLNVALAPLQRAAVTNHATGTLVVLEDVTGRTRLEEQLQQREKLSSIGLLAAGVAHEINTPLTGVSSYTQMLLRMFSESDPKHALLQKIHRQTERATGIVNNLLNFSRTGGATEFSSVEVHRMLDDTMQLLEPQLRQSQVEVIREYTAERSEAFGNAAKLQQVFTNLVMNARDAIPDGGRITLVTKNEGDVMVIEVTDTGIGIAPENVARIYDPFFTTKGVGRGTGLGLFVTYGIVQEHSGHIGVESAPGKGTTFRITLPIETTRAHLQAAGD